MSQSKVMTNDRGARQSRKEFLAEQVKFALEPRSEASEHSPVVEVSLPDNYDIVTSQELYATLQSRGLTPEQASDVISIINGFPQKTGFNFNIIGIKEKEIIPEKKIEKTIKKISVNLLSNYRSLPIKDLYRYLTTQCLLTIEQANDVVDLLNGKPQRLKDVVFNISVEEE